LFKVHAGQLTIVPVISPAAACTTGNIVDVDVDVDVDIVATNTNIAIVIVIIFMAATTKRSTPVFAE